MCSPIVMLAASRSGVACSPLNNCSTSTACSTREAARGSKVRPFSFSTRPRPIRSNSGTPSADSSSARAPLTADCERESHSAATRVEPPRAIATKNSSWRTLRRRAGN